MKLKERFIEQSIDIRYQVLEPEKFEKIANDYAIEFYLWMKDNEERIKNGKIITDENLLKEFKKEKGL
jgi:hypothetical protein